MYLTYIVTIAYIPKMSNWLMRYSILRILGRDESIVRLTNQKERERERELKHEITKLCMIEILFDDAGDSIMLLP